MERLRIGIIGQGTAGSAAALFLSRAGHDVAVYERVAAPGPVGAGIVLQPTGMAVLQALGLRDQVLARGAPLTGLTVTSPRSAGRSRTIVDLDYEDLAPDLYGLGIHRGALFQALAGALADSPVRCETGIEARGIAQDTGTWVVLADGTRRGPHDLVIVADGARSLVAESYFPSRRSSAYPWGALWFVAEDPEQRFHGRLTQVVRGAERLIGLLPTGLGPERGTAGPHLVSLFYSVRGDRVAELRRHFGAWRDEVARLMPASKAVLAQIPDESALLYTSYQDVHLFPWHRENAVVLGDAGHAMSPQLGQGANLALWEALVLADCVQSAPDVASALVRYSARRRAHLGWFSFATRLLTPFFQGDSSALGALRDVTMPLLSRFGPFRRLMIASMVGNTTGPLRAPLSLPSRPPPLLTP